MKGFKNTWIVTEEGLRKTSFTYDQHFITIGRDEEGLEELPEDYVIVPGFIDVHVKYLFSHLRVSFLHTSVSSRPVTIIICLLGNRYQHIYDND